MVFSNRGKGVFVGQSFCRHGLNRAYRPFRFPSLDGRGLKERLKEGHNLEIWKQSIAERNIFKVKRLEIRTRHLVDTSFNGDYMSLFKGCGLEFVSLKRI